MGKYYLKDNLDPVTAGAEIVAVVPKLLSVVGYGNVMAVKDIPGCIKAYLDIVNTLPQEERIDTSIQNHNDAMLRFTVADTMVTIYFVKPTRCDVVIETYNKDGLLQTRGGWRISDG